MVKLTPQPTESTTTRTIRIRHFVTSAMVVRTSIFCAALPLLLLVAVVVVVHGFVGMVPRPTKNTPLQQRVPTSPSQSSSSSSSQPNYANGHGHDRWWLSAVSNQNSNSNNKNNNNNNNNDSSSTTTTATTTTGSSRRPRRTVFDRTPEEARALLQDMVQTVLTVGPRTGPTRTLQALTAIQTTSQEFLRQSLRPQSSTASSSSAASSSQSSTTDQIPKYLRLFFERMGSTYIKLGQFIASSPSLFPASYVTEFQKCLDSTTPLPYRTIRAVLEQEIDISQTFAYIDETPLASASIAQVHTARLLTGEDVVIKVQKPGIETVLQADLGFLYLAARILEYLQPDWERTSLSAVTSDIRASMLEELDFTLEARNTIEFRRFLQDNGLLTVATAPLVYLQHSTKRVLVMERLNGVSMLDDRMLSMTNDPTIGTEAILTALNIWTLSIQKMPWFHADVHAGNLLLLQDGRVGFIDFGIVGRISPQIFTAVTELSTALVNQDSLGMAQALCQMGATDANVNVPQFAKDIDTVLDRIYNNVVPSIVDDITITMDGRRQVTSATATLNMNDSDITDLLLEIVQMTEQNGLKLPREFGLLVKQSLYFDRYLKILAPGVNIMNDERIAKNIIGETGGSSSSRRPTTPGDGSGTDRMVIDV